MSNDFKVSEKIIVMGILEPYYPVNCLGYALDVPEDEIRAVLDWYHKGAVRSFSDAIWIMIREQNLSEDDVREVFSYLDSQEIVERAIKDAKEEKEQTFPDTGDSEVYAEAFKAGYVFSSALLFHNLKIRTKSSIEEINALFSMSPAMEEWIEAMSHTSDKLELRNQLFEKQGMEKVYAALTELFGPDVTARLKENEATAEINRSIRELPKDIGIKFVDIINNKIAPLSKSGAGEKEVEEALFQAIVEGGLLPENVSLEQFRQRVKNAEADEESGMNYESEYRKQTGKDLTARDYAE